MFKAPFEYRGEVMSEHCLPNAGIRILIKRIEIEANGALEDGGVLSESLISCVWLCSSKGMVCWL